MEHSVPRAATGVKHGPLPEPAFAGGAVLHLPPRAAAWNTVPLHEESDGTRKFIALSGPVSHTLQTGSILVLDELESSLHPKLTQAIVDLFHSPVNDQNAQLICATHDVTLLDPDRFRRDQIWFCEKDGQGGTDLYSLADFDSNQVRPDSKFSRQYLLGLFGAVPKLARFEEAVEHAIR